MESELKATQVKRIMQKTHLLNLFFFQIKVEFPFLPLFYYFYSSDLLFVQSGFVRFIALSLKRDRG